MKIAAKGVTSVFFYIFLTLLLTPRSFSQQDRKSVV